MLTVSSEDRADSVMISAHGMPEADSAKLRDRIAAEIRVAVCAEMCALASAMKKFAPDLMADFLARHQDAAKALDDFTGILNDATK